VTLRGFSHSEYGRGIIQPDIHQHCNPSTDTHLVCQRCHLKPLQHIIVLVFLMSDIVSAVENDVPPKPHDEGLVALLLSTSSEWKNCRSKVATLAGEAEVHQTSWSAVVDLPATPTSNDLAPSVGQKTMKTVRKEGSFLRIESAKVSFKVDIINDKLL